MLQIKLKNPIGKIVNIQGGRYKVPSTVFCSKHIKDSVITILKCLGIEFEIIGEKQKVSLGLKNNVERPEESQSAGVSTAKNTESKKSTDAKKPKRRTRKTTSKKQSSKTKSKTKKE